LDYSPTAARAATPYQGRRLWIKRKNASMENALRQGGMMRVAVSSKGKNRDAQVEPRFAKAAYFLIVDTDDMTFHALRNPSEQDSTDTGAVRVVIYAGAEAVLTGDCEPNARHMLTTSGVRVFQGVSGTVGAAVERLRRGWLAESSDPETRVRCGTGGGGIRRR
jgi:predicted Fe-Mo cluster-binding NifX family protein